MLKNKRKANKQAIIEGSRLYTIVANGYGYGGDVMHYFELGTVVRKTGSEEWLNEFVELGERGLSQNLRRHHYI